MAELKEKKFGYAVVPPCPPCPPHPLPPFPPGPIPPGMTVHDWVQYINNYVDVRARQIYNKLKDELDIGSTEKVHNKLLLKDINNGKTYEVFMKDGILCSDEYIPD